MKTIIFHRGKMNGAEVREFLEQWMQNGVEDLTIQFVVREKPTNRLTH